MLLGNVAVRMLRGIVCGCGHCGLFGEALSGDGHSTNAVRSGDDEFSAALQSLLWFRHLGDICNLHILWDTPGKTCSAHASE